MLYTYNKSQMTSNQSSKWKYVIISIVMMLIVNQCYSQSDAEFGGNTDGDNYREAQETQNSESGEFGGNDDGDNYRGAQETQNNESGEFGGKDDNDNFKSNDRRGPVSPIGPDDDSDSNKPVNPDSSSGDDNRGPVSPNGPEDDSNSNGPVNPDSSNNDDNRGPVSPFGPEDDNNNDGPVSPDSSNGDENSDGPVSPQPSSQDNSQTPKDQQNLAPGHGQEWDIDEQVDPKQRQIKLSPEQVAKKYKHLEEQLALKTTKSEFKQLDDGGDTVYEGFTPHYSQPISQQELVNTEIPKQDAFRNGIDSSQQSQDSYGTKDQEAQTEEQGNSSEASNEINNQNGGEENNESNNSNDANGQNVQSNEPPKPNRLHLPNPSFITYLSQLPASERQMMSSLLLEKDYQGTNVVIIESYLPYRPLMGMAALWLSPKMLLRHQENNDGQSKGSIVVNVESDSTIRASIKAAWTKNNITALLGVSSGPIVSEGHQAADTAHRIAQALIRSDLDGIDFTFTDSLALEKGYAQEWLTEMMLELRKLMPDKIITHTLPAHYFSEGYYRKGGYRDLPHGLVDQYNIRYFGEGPYAFNSYETIFIRSEEPLKGVSITQIKQLVTAVAIDEMKKWTENVELLNVPQVLLVKPASYQASISSGYVQAQQLGRWILQYKAEHTWNAGVGAVRASRKISIKNRETEREFLKIIAQMWH